MIKTMLLLAAAALVGVAIGFGLDGNDAGGPVGATPTASSDPALRLLRDELERERSERMALAARVARLEEQTVTALFGVTEASPTSLDEDELEAAPRSDPGATRRFPEQALLDAGFTRAEVSAYRERIDAIELERLYLRDQAAREGWLDTPRFARERRQLFEALQDTREEFGDELYDWTLYARGHPNRVKVTDVMEGSAAATVGLAAGDIVVRYGERPIFSPRELRQQTLEGTPQENVPVEFVRNGEMRRVFVPRGPLGIRIESVVQKPTG